MAHFVCVKEESKGSKEARKTFVNLDHVISIEPLGWCRNKLTTVDGKTFCGDFVDNSALKDLNAGPVIQAEPGYSLVTVVLPNEKRERTELHVDIYPIVGWRTRTDGDWANAIDPTYAIALTDLDANTFEDASLYVRLPDGSIIGAEEGVYSSLDAALDEIFTGEWMAPHIGALHRYRAQHDGLPAPEANTAAEAAPLYRPTPKPDARSSAAGQ